MTLATPYAAPMIPVNAGLWLGLASNAMIVYAPEAMPAPPAPEIALPTMSDVLFFETAGCYVRLRYCHSVWVGQADRK